MTMHYSKRPAKKQEKTENRTIGQKIPTIKLLNTYQVWLQNRQRVPNICKQKNISDHFIQSDNLLKHKMFVLLKKYMF